MRELAARKELNASRASAHQRCWVSAGATGELAFGYHARVKPAVQARLLPAAVQEASRSTTLDLAQATRPLEVLPPNERGTAVLLVHQAYRFALDPAPRQRRALSSATGGSRFAYNWGLALVKQRLDARAAGQDVQVPWTLPALRREWNQAKEQEAPWWRENSKEAYSSGLDGLARALGNFSASRAGTRKGRRVGFPRFKRKHRARESCRFTTGPIRVEPDRHHVTLPKLGTVRTHESTRKLARRLEQGTARILSATISRTADRWFVSFTVEVQRRQGRPLRAASTVGVDVGVRHLAVLSTGEQIANPRPLERLQRTRRRLQRRWSRQDRARRAAGRRRPGRRQRVTRRRLARLEARAANIRRDALHKLTTRLVRTHGTIVVEHLNVSGMVRNRRLARVISDAGFGEIRQLLTYKSTWGGARLVVAEPFFPSSKTCSACGHVRAKLSLAARTFQCERCGLVVDRDLNAARNLAALVVVVAGSGPETGINACVRDCQPTGDGGRSDNPDARREAAGSQQPVRV